MRRILHLTRDFPPLSKGGISTAVGEWAQAQQRSGDTVSIISFDAWRPKSGKNPALVPNAEFTPTGIAIIRVNGPEDLHAAQKFADEQCPDLSHLHHGMLWEFAVQLGFATVLHVHVLQARLNALRGIKETLSSKAQEIAIANADAVLCPSHAVAHEIAKQRGDATVIGQGITVPAAQPASAKSGITVSYIGRFADIKGTQEFIDAMQQVIAKRPEVRVVMAGGLPDNAKSERRWQTRIKETLPSAVLTGWLPPQEVNALYQQSHMVVVPSWYETLGLTALEAMAHRVPVVAANCGGLAELITHKETGVLVPPRNVSALSAAVLSLIEDPELARRLGTQAGAQVADRYAWPDRIRALSQVYSTLLPA